MQTKMIKIWMSLSFFIVMFGSSRTAAHDEFVYGSFVIEEVIINGETVDLNRDAGEIKVTLGETIVTLFPMWYGIGYKVGVWIDPKEAGIRLDGFRVEAPYLAGIQPEYTAETAADLHRPFYYLRPWDGGLKALKFPLAIKGKTFVGLYTMRFDLETGLHTFDLHLAENLEVAESHEINLLAIRKVN